MALTPEGLMEALKAVQDPNTGKPFAATRSLKNLQVSEGDVSFDLELGYPARSQHAAIRRNWWRPPRRCRAWRTCR